ncbi:MAG: putative oxidoreductase [Proteiniphilum sp.]|jgi:putative oxidoreductase|nr:putative oxidoreductase [Proteiniphilum sp.]
MRKKEELLQLGWLILRAGIGISIFLHGIPKLTGGVEMWTYIGGSMSIFGINFAPAFWGFLAAVAEAIGGALFALGLFFRPAALMLTGTMVVALATHLAAGDDFMVFGHALDLLIVYTGAILIGAGRYSLDARLLPKLA